MDGTGAQIAMLVVTFMLMTNQMSCYNADIEENFMWIEFMKFGYIFK